MKKPFPIILLGAAIGSATLFAACGSASSDSTATTTASTSAAETTSSSGSATEAPVLGGWTVNTETRPSLSSDEEGLFKKATEGSGNNGLTPVACIADQLVSGTNHAYLCTEADKAWKIVTVYEDLQGNAKVIGTSDLDLSDIKTTDEAEDLNIVGGWRISEKNTASLPDNAQKAFDKASKDYTGLSLKPIALLATQLVSGTNYKILCNGTVVVPDATPGIYVVDVYEDLNGSAKITDAKRVQIIDYVGSN